MIEEDFAPGKVARKTADKRARIEKSAREVFDEAGYQAATTQEIADRAGVSIGTLFRYAGTKAELLLWVGRQRLEVAGEPGGCSVDEVVARVFEPLLDFAVTHPENFIAYQRELMFGPAGRHRDEALAGVVAMERLIGTALADELGGLPAGLSVEEVGRSFMSMIFIELVRLCMHVESRKEVEELVPIRLAVFRAGLRAVRAGTTPG